MIIVFIGLIMVNLPYMKFAFNNEGTEKPYVIALLGYFFIAGAQEVLNKIIMISKYVSPYKLLFFEGAISMGLQIIALIIISFVNGLFKEKTYEEFLQQMTGWLGISLFAFWICEFGLNLSVTLTNFYYSPTHRSISDCIACLLIIIYSACAGQSNYDSVLTITCVAIGFPILLLECFVYNEIIIFHIFGLDQNTSNEVSKRANEEQKQFESIEAKLIVHEVAERTSQVGNGNDVNEEVEQEENLSPQ